MLLNKSVRHAILLLHGDFFWSIIRCAGKARFPPDKHPIKFSRDGLPSKMLRMEHLYAKYGGAFIHPEEAVNMKFFGKTVAALAALVIMPLAARANLRVATASTYPPYEFLNEKGELDGFDKDLMEEIGRRLGEKIVWLDTGHYDMVIPSLVTGRVDVIAAGMSATPIRAKRVLFSTPYVPTMASFVTAPNVAVKKLEDLRGLRGCVPVGTTQDVFLTPLAGKLGFQIKNFAKIEECLWDIVTGRSDFTLMDVPVADKTLELPSFKGKAVRGYTFQLTGAGKALAVNLDNTALKNKLDGAIAAMEADGALPALREKWKLGKK